MAILPETSFMPQQPLLRVEGSSRRSESVNLSLVIALIIFFTVLAIAGGVYFYTSRLHAEVLAKGQQLADQEKNFNVNEIAVYKILQTDLATAKQLVDSHTIFSVLLDMIETHAAQNVGLTTFGYKKDEGNIKVSLAGQAPDYAAVYFQVQEWRSTPYVKKVDVGALALDERTGVVTFSATVEIDPVFLNSSRVIQEQLQHQEKLPVNTPENIQATLPSNTPTGTEPLKPATVTGTTTSPTHPATSTPPAKAAPIQQKTKK